MFFPSHQHKRQIEEYAKRERQFEGLIAKYKQRCKADADYIASMETKSQQVRLYCLTFASKSLFANSFLFCFVVADE